MRLNPVAVSLLCGALLSPLVASAQFPFKLPIKTGGSKGAPARATQPAAPQKKAVPGQAQKESKPSVDFIGQANAQRNAIEAHLFKRDGTAVPEPMLQDYRKSVDQVVPVSAAAAAWHAREYTQFVLSNAWRLPDRTAQATEVARILDGKLVTSAVTTGKKLKLGFQAEKGWCYATHMRWQSDAGTEQMNNFDWAASAGNGVLQHFNNYQQREDRDMMEGVCATKSTTVTATADLTFAGNRNGIRYVVVGWPKEKFPLFESTYMRVTWKDPCDVANFKSLWTDPIPGSLVYLGKEPVLVTEVDRAGQPWTTVVLASGREARHQKLELTSKAPTATAFVTQWSYQRCNRGNPQTPESQKLAACHVKVDKRYQAQFDRAEDEKNRARTGAQLDQAEGRIQRLNELDRADRARECDPLENKLADKQEKMFGEIVDHFADHPYQDPLDRAGRLNVEHKAL